MAAIPSTSASIHWIQNILHRLGEQHGFHFSIIKADETVTAYITQVDENTLEKMTEIFKHNSITVQTSCISQYDPISVILELATNSTARPMAYQPCFQQTYDKG